ncbi:MAG: hypothetical protein ABL881_09990 [Novosphingobium sp.]
MSFGDFMGLVAAMGGLVGIVAILGQAYQRRLEHKERIAELKVASPHATGRDDTVARLEQRLRVLERIATDKTTGLASQIEDLREDAAAR